MYCALKYNIYLYTLLNFENTKYHDYLSAFKHLLYCISIHLQNLSKIQQNKKLSFSCHWDSLNNFPFSCFDLDFIFDWSALPRHCWTVTERRGQRVHVIQLKKGKGPLVSTDSTTGGQQTGAGPATWGHRLQQQSLNNYARAIRGLISLRC